MQLQLKTSQYIASMNSTEQYIRQAFGIGTVLCYSPSFTGGGLGTGIAALTNRQIHIADSSREIKQKEIDLARKKGINPVGFVRAVGEAMTVLTATANAPAFPKAFTSSVRTMTSAIAI